MRQRVARLSLGAFFSHLLIKIMKRALVILRKGTIIHIVCWLTVIILNLVLSNSDDMFEELRRLSTSLGCYFVLFYINYFVLIPRLLFREHTVLYSIVSLIIVASMFMGLRSEELYVRQQYHLELLSREMNSSEISSREGQSERIASIQERIASAFDLSNYHPFMRRLNSQHFSGLLLIFSISLLVRFIDRWREQERRELELEKERVSSELDYLKKQINPHFLFNALNSIYSLTLPFSDDRASESILKLSSILRYMLYETDHKLVLLTSEIDILHNYIGLQKLRITDKTSIDFTIEGNVEGYGIEPLLFIPFIENAFKYGVDSANGSSIVINLSVKDSMLKFDVTNTVVSANRRTKHSGIGIKNIERRLEILYPRNHVFNIKSEDDKFYIYISLPLKRI